MERWVSQGLKVPDVEIYQNLNNLPTGTYTLSANCQNVQQTDVNLVCSGATFYAGDESVEVNKSATYSLTFTVLQGDVKIGLKTMSSTGNWVSFDNLKLVYNGISVDSLHLELQKNIDNAQLILNGGVGVENLQAAIDNAKLYLTSESSKDISNVARILDNAIIAYRISNATGTIPELFTNEYVATGSTIALGRFTFRSNGASIYEKGFFGVQQMNQLLQIKSQQKNLAIEEIYIGWIN